MSNERKVMLQKNTDDFNTMRKMLSDIEVKIMQVDPVRQFQFYQPLQEMILQAWQDANNPDDSFLYQPTK